jgi:hypothetical protein
MLCMKTILPIPSWRAAIFGQWSRRLAPYRHFIVAITVVLVCFGNALGQTNTGKDPLAIQVIQQSIKALRGSTGETPSGNLTVVGHREKGVEGEPNSITYTVARLPGDHCHFHEQRSDRPHSTSGGSEHHVALSSSHSATITREHLPLEFPAAVLQCLLDDQTTVIQSIPLERRFFTHESPNTTARASSCTAIAINRAPFSANGAAIRQIWVFDRDSNLPVFVEELQYQNTVLPPPGIGPMPPMETTADLRGPRTYYTSFQDNGKVRVPQAIRTIRPGSTSTTMTMELPSASAGQPSAN